MKFWIRRTSGWGQESPLSECKWETFTRIDQRTASSPLDLNPIARETWLSDGTNHRFVPNKGIARDLEDYHWTIEIDDLIAFVAKHGKCVVFPVYPDDHAGLPCIEIYDDYRE